MARLAVLPDEQNKGIAKIMLKYGLDVLKKRGFKAMSLS
ncbi:MAG: GNAT family N-acetyltransferase [Lachnospiraceae bacterium]|nr:GNAT family N-acetyltransferase [Lachnospiraceae bacterium]